MKNTLIIASFLCTNILCFVAHSQNLESVSTNQGELIVGYKIKFLKPSNGPVYANAYLTGPGGNININGGQYENVTMTIKKIKMKKDKELKMAYPVIIVGLADQSKHYDITINIHKALETNEIMVVQ
jgi:hypothetical protein